MQELREACAQVAARASWVHIRREVVPAHGASLPPPSSRNSGEEEDQAALGDREQRAAHWLQLDAINFGSGWFPTLRKQPGLSGYRTLAGALRRRAERHGPWTAGELQALTAGELAAVLGQEPDHPLMELFARSLADLGARVLADHCGFFAAVADAAAGSAVRLARKLGSWDCFADSSRYGELEVPFLKRAQIAAADLARAGVYEAVDLRELTMFADNLVPHVLRLDGVLEFDRRLVERIEREELLEHGSPEEVEIRACAVHAVELLAAARGDTCAAELDQLLWWRGQQPRYKVVPRHRCRCTAY